MRKLFIILLLIPSIVFSQRVITSNSILLKSEVLNVSSNLSDLNNAATARSNIGLGNVTNTSDANKPVSTAQQTALDLKANIASPTFTGTVGGITASMVGLGNVTNESKATMFASPAFTGTVTHPASTSFTTPVLGSATGTSLVLSSFLNEAKGADIASATTTDIGAATGNYLDVTGVTTITGLGTVQAGTRRIVTFTGALTLTHNATSLILPGAVNRTTVAGDCATFISLGAGNWRCVSYNPTTVTGTGGRVLANTPTLVTPNIGVATATTLNGHTFTAGSSTFTGTAAAVYTFPAATKTIAANDGSNWTISGQAIGDIPVASSTTAYGKVAAVATGSYLRSAGTGTAPVWSTVTLPNTIATGEMLVATATNVISAQNTRQNWTSFAVTGSNATTTGQVLVDITGLTSGTLTNSTLYEIEGFLNVTTSAVTTGVQYAIGAGGSGGAAVVMVQLVGNTTGLTTTNENIVSTTAIAARLLTSAQSGMMYFHGWVTTRGTGTATISLQHLKVTSGTSTVLIGSWFRYRLAN